MLNKLATLKEYRSAGEQTIKVQPDTVTGRGQAIVGNVSRGVGTTENGGLSGAASVRTMGVDPLPPGIPIQVRPDGQPHEPCPAAEPGSALLCHEQRHAGRMPSAGGPRLDGVPVSRGARGERQR